ncbi:MAG: nucleotide exchange factor GrpE [Methanobrevibacter sp.]|jgi:molecular chaperone GrpE|nr:nucleotide exchange factor GrpE [Candidatus Methanovirga aequatorialis]
MADDTKITKLKEELKQLKSDLEDKNEKLTETEEKLDLKDQNLIDANEDLVKKDEELEEQNSRYLRLQADFENFKKQNEKHNQNIINFANENLIMNILDCYEDLERVLKQSKNMDELKEGTELIYAKLKNVLEKEGLKEIEAKDVKFDPFKHEALMVEDKDDYEDGVVIEELMKGYTLKDKVIKYSKVKVCKKPKKENGEIKKE